MVRCNLYDDLLYSVVLAMFLFCTGMSQLVVADQPDTASDNQPAIWNVSGAESDEEAAKAFLELLILDPHQQRLNNLHRRPAMVKVSELYYKGQYLEAVRVFQVYFFAKLRGPQHYGLSPLDANPFVEGVAGDFRWPPAPMRANINPERAMAGADRIFKGETNLGGKPHPLGEPGQVDWYAPRQRGGFSFHNNDVPFQPLWTGWLFNALLQGYMISGDEKYLERWAAYMDDWARNATFVNDVPAMFVSDRVHGAGFTAPINFLKAIGGVARQMPAKRIPEVIPPVTFARVLGKYVTQFPPMSMIYIRSNTHNWTPTGQLMSLSLWFDEFKIAPLYFREARRRQIEDPDATQNLPDGTSSELDPWYNENYVSVISALDILNRRSAVNSWDELPWVMELRNDIDWQAQLQDNVDARVSYLLRLRTPQNQWPVGINGGDKRRAIGFEFQGVALDAFSDPVNRAMIDAIRGRDVKVPYTDEWFPYAGYNIVRDGWSRHDGYGFLFNATQPAAYGAFRGRSNNNTFGLNAYGMDLLVDDTLGHYMYPSSPIKVDQSEQFFNAGVYKVPDPQRHKAYQVDAWWQPDDARWHSSERFSLMEGVYDGPWLSPKNAELPEAVDHGYGPDESAQGAGVNPRVFTGIDHQRLVLYVRDAKLWIVTDRMLAKGTHDYRQYWRIASDPSPDGTPAFKVDQIEIDANRGRIMANATNGNPPVQLAMHQFSDRKLNYNKQLVKRAKRHNRQMMYSWTSVTVDWKGQGDQQVITAIKPSRASQHTDGQLQSISEISSGARGLGFRATTSDGQTISYLASPVAGDRLVIGDVNTKSEALLLTHGHGVVLGCEQLSINGQPIDTTFSDFEFAYADGQVTTVTPIYRPIQRIEILPDREVFVDQQTITMTCPTPGVEIRYTLDGSDPQPDSTLYTGPFVIDRDVLIKARAYRPGTKHNPVQLSGTHATVPWRATFRKINTLDAMPARETKAGLAHAYFQGDWRQMLLTLDEMKPMKRQMSATLLDPAIIPNDNAKVDADQSGSREEPYAIISQGFIDVPADGVYTFHAPHEYVWPATAAGYELRVFVGQRFVPWGHRRTQDGLNLWYPGTNRHGFGNWSIGLKKGLHPIRIEFVDFRTNAAAFYNRPGLKDFIWEGVTPDLRVSGPGMDEPQPIPSSWLRH